jgi:hypothetical protein
MRLRLWRRASVWMVAWIGRGMLVISGNVTSLPANGQESGRGLGLICLKSGTGAGWG